MVRPPSPVTSTEVPSRIAATRAWVAMLPIALACVTSRVPHTAGPVTPGSPSGTTGAGRPRQLTPRSPVRAIEVHGACLHGAVPSTNASRVETKVTEAALNPAGTGPPEGRVMPAGA